MRLKLAIGIGVLLVAVIISCQDEKSIEFARYYSAGSVVYQNHCQNCHGSHGEGLGGLIPPLTDTAFLQKNRHQLPCILQNGLKGKLSVSNKNFEGAMPATGLAPIEIAQALTFAVNSFGNKLGLLNTGSITSDLLNCK